MGDGKPKPSDEERKTAMDTFMEAANTAGPDADPVETYKVLKDRGVFDALDHRAAMKVFQPPDEKQKMLEQATAQFSASMKEPVSPIDKTQCTCDPLDDDYDEWADDVLCPYCQEREEQRMLANFRTAFGLS